MANAREQYMHAVASLTQLTRTQAERLASRLAKQGELQSAQVSRFAEDLVRRTQKNREAMSRLVQREVRRQLGVMGIATRDEVARLQQRVRALEQAPERVESQSVSSRTRTTTARRSSGRGGTTGQEKVSPASAGTKAAGRTSGAATRSTAKRSATTRASSRSTKSSASSGRAPGTSGGSSAPSGQTTGGSSSDAS